MRKRGRCLALFEFCASEIQVSRIFPSSVGGEPESRRQMSGIGMDASDDETPEAERAQTRTGLVIRVR